VTVPSDREERRKHDLGFGNGERRANANAWTNTERNERTLIPAGTQQ
jgi:hypothetical protein